MIELVVVVIIIAIIAAIAIPKMSRGSAGAGESALSQDLATVRNAIEVYQTEHGGVFPSNQSADTFARQLTQYTDSQGNYQSSRDATHIYGPYLRSIPPLPVGTNKGQSSVAMSAAPTNTSAGWYYDGQNFWANDPVSDTDAAGTPYNTY